MTAQNRNILPQGVTESAFKSAISQFIALLGAENVLTEDNQLAPYMKIMMPVPEATHAPSAALMPTEVPQIQKIVRVCNQFKTPIWPISTGHNLGYGSAAPESRG